MVLTEFLIHFQARFMKGKTYWSCCYGHLILMEKFIVKWKIGKIALTLINSLSMHFICFNWCLLYHHNCICTLFSLEKHFRWLPQYKPQFWSERIVHWDPRDIMTSPLVLCKAYPPHTHKFSPITRWKQHSGDESRNTFGADDGAQVQQNI